MSAESVMRECLELQKSRGFQVASGIWIRFRDGRIVPKISPWGAVLLNINSDNMGNFNIPSGNWWQQVVSHLGVSSAWLDSFAKAFDGEEISPQWFALMSIEENEAWRLGKKFAEEQLKLG
jgi:hypothetical protein